MSKEFYVELPKVTQSYGMVPPLHMCVAFLDVAKKLGCDAFRLQAPGHRPLVFSVASVEAELGKDPLLHALKGMGIVEGGRGVGVVNVGGRHLTVRKMRRTDGGLYTPAQRIHL